MSATPSLIFGWPQFLIRLVRFAHVVHSTPTADRARAEDHHLASLRVLERHEIQQHPRIEGLAVFADRPILILGPIVKVLALRWLLAPGDVIDVTRYGLFAVEFSPNLHPRFGMREILSTKRNFLFVDEVLAFLEKQKGFKAGIVMCRLFDIVCSFSVLCR
jgi:hypothetical protein